MRIQSIYTNNQTNFNARFINDKNGNFQKPWNDALKSTDFFNKAEKFSNGLPSDSLEILSIKTLDLVVSQVAGLWSAVCGH